MIFHISMVLFHIHMQSITDDTKFRPIFKAKIIDEANWSRLEPIIGSIRYKRKR